MALSIDMFTDIDAPIEAVWAAISTQEGLRGWFNPHIEIDPVVGGRVEFYGTHGNSPYRFGGAVVAIDPPTRITWEWRSMLEEWPAATLLTIELSARDGGTHAEMRHHGWEALGPEQSISEHADFVQGWAMTDGLLDLKVFVEGPAGS